MIKVRKFIGKWVFFYPGSFFAMIGLMVSFGIKDTRKFTEWANCHLKRLLDEDSTS
jgi:hypothetical protein